MSGTPPRQVRADPQPPGGEDGDTTVPGLS
jgi:hypothetical protein